MIKIIDLFAGIGGIRKGAEQAFGKNNLECVFTSEINKFSIQTYKANYGEEHIHGDITKVEAKDIPDHDLLLGGFPCQAFSHAGKGLGFADTRGTLFFDINRILAEKKPKVFLLENVKKLISHDKGQTFKVILNCLEQNGYKVFYKVLKARDFGVPQNRERIFIVGFLDHSVEFNFPEPIGVPTRVGDILEPSTDPKYTLSDKLWAGHQKRKENNKLNGKGFGYQMVSHDSAYTGTLSARYYKDGSEILINQGSQNPRKITPKEAARLQGFPEDFVIPVSDNQAYKQFGNSVCVPVIAAIVNEIKKHI